MSTERNAAVVRRVIEEIWNHGDLDVADALYSRTYVNHGGLIPDLVCGPEAIKFGVVLYRRAFPRLRIVVDDLVAEGETVELHWTAHSTPLTDGDDSAGAHPQRTLTGTTLSRLTGGQIAESWTTWDRKLMLVQLGLAPQESGPGPDTNASSACSST